MTGRNIAVVVVFFRTDAESRCGDHYDRGQEKFVITRDAVHPPPDQIYKPGLDQPANQYKKAADGDNDIVPKPRDALRNRQDLSHDEGDHQDYADDIYGQFLGGKQDDRQS